eukprot:m.483753 g.483753  ORF g.483753 m.483753 type:complete len:55 (-) comp66924_c0_seq1:138-302(-)
MPLRDKCRVRASTVDAQSKLTASPSQTQPNNQSKLCSLSARESGVHPAGHPRLT